MIAERFIGGKYKQLKLPEGWEEIKSGRVKRGDRVLDLEKLKARRVCFIPIEKMDKGQDATNYTLVIRRTHAR